LAKKPLKGVSKSVSFGYIDFFLKPLLEQYAFNIPNFNIFKTNKTAVKSLFLKWLNEFYRVLKSSC